MGSIGPSGTWEIPSLLAPPIFAFGSDTRARIQIVSLLMNLLVASLAPVRWWNAPGFVRHRLVSLPFAGRDVMMTLALVNFNRV